MKSKGLPILLGTLALGFLAWFIYALIQAGPQFQSGILALVGSTAIAIWSHRSAKAREIEARHYREKRAAYMEFLESFFSLLNASTGIKPKPPMEELAAQLQNYRRMLLLWGNLDVIRSWRKLEDLILNAGDPHKALVLYDEFLREIRRDLGHDDPLLKQGELISLLLKPDARTRQPADNR